MAEKPFSKSENKIFVRQKNPSPVCNSNTILLKTKRNANNASGPGLNTNANQLQIRSWADRVQKFSSSLNEKYAFSNDEEPRSFVTKRQDFSEISPFLIQKCPQKIQRQ